MVLKSPKDTDAHIACVLMMKNERKRLHVTLNSCIGTVKSFIIYDTGSKDESIQIATDIAKKNDIPLYIKQDFIDPELFNFRDSRNTLQDFADTIDGVDYYLWMDTNDELRNGHELLKTANELLHKKETTGFLLCQEWFSGGYDKYWNIRFVRARSQWRYKMRVHEWPQNLNYVDGKDKDGKSEPLPYRIDQPNHPILYQDRTLDDDKTGKRFTRDKTLLLQDYYDDKNDPRVVFYLAQTCGCLNQVDEAFYYYKIRTTQDGFWEEKFHAFNRAGELAVRLGHPWKECMMWFIQAFEVMPRAEPMVEIARHYMAEKNWLLAFNFCDLACKLTYPSHLLLFVNKKHYDYERWHMMGTIGHNSGFYVEGKVGATRAYECTQFRQPIDKENLDKYRELEREKENKDIINLSKQEFIDKTCREVLLQNPKMNKRDIQAKTALLWKLKKEQVAREAREKQEQEQKQKQIQTLDTLVPNIGNGVNGTKRRNNNKKKVNKK